ncbi:hypothetical protein WN66_05237 [Saccharomyces cerevisiae]|uniref:Putative uncharacterized protein YNL296W n=2 Tax=Saccharomyces cerevisiae TaxID=4932 RepID=YN36_YEAST|nr:RecName: Full=Putative uncharacterized protein YNL296W [Saccharomyces cerevisiae S288C]AAC49103.1 Ynl0459p [Saccharomyces cerevisiae]CAY82317.1 EC1118_1N9_0397p [Saccharomyces cerevisiae EC1118]AAS56691.1 YNL296W [Saccharomyces cerevisiae]KZV08328.1 hypothetical protein WN66_05237 [Saccharomyces cerevisiae]CAA96215.1 unnamed protein product [Saccharomyces cerevisiae]
MKASKISDSRLRGIDGTVDSPCRHCIARVVILAFLDWQANTKGSAKSGCLSSSSKLCTLFNISMDLSLAWRMVEFLLFDSEDKERNSASSCLCMESNPPVFMAI